MCLIVDAKLTKEFRAKNEPLTLYKVYQIDTELGRVLLRSPFRSTEGRQGTQTSGAFFISTISTRNKELPLTGIGLTDNSHALDEWDDEEVQASGFHAFTNRSDAQRLADYLTYQYGTHYGTHVVCEIQSHTTSVLLAGTTPSQTLISELKGFSWPTIVVSELTITKEEYEKAITRP